MYIHVNTQMWKGTIGYLHKYTYTHTHSFRNIAVLQTLDAEGRRINYMREARDKKRQFIFFRGPGKTVIMYCT